MVTARLPQDDIDRAVDALRGGEVVAFPTETVYGLGADAQNPDAVRKVFELKGRPPTHPLIIHIEPTTLMALNMHGRFCPDCDLLIVHQDQMEGLLAAHMAKHDPSVIGNDYLVLGTLERKVWREGMQQAKPIGEMLKHIADFREVVTFQVEPVGWYPKE